MPWSCSACCPRSCEWGRGLARRSTGSVRLVAAARARGDRHAPAARGRHRRRDGRDHARPGHDDHGAAGPGRGRPVSGRWRRPDRAEPAADLRTRRDLEDDPGRTGPRRGRVEDGSGSPRAGAPRSSGSSWSTTADYERLLVASALDDAPASRGSDRRSGCRPRTRPWRSTHGSGRAHRGVGRRRSSPSPSSAPHRTWTPLSLLSSWWTRTRSPRPVASRRRTPSGLSVLGRPRRSTRRGRAGGGDAVVRYTTSSHPARRSPAVGPPALAVVSAVVLLALASLATVLAASPVTCRGAALAGCAPSVSPTETYDDSSSRSSPPRSLWPRSLAGPSGVGCPRRPRLLVVAAGHGSVGGALARRPLVERTPGPGSGRGRGGPCDARAARDPPAHAGRGCCELTRRVPVDGLAWLAC